jgi:hypothetical protein
MWREEFTGARFSALECPLLVSRVMQRCTGERGNSHLPSVARSAGLSSPWSARCEMALACMEFPIYSFLSVAVVCGVRKKVTLDVLTVYFLNTCGFRAIFPVEIQIIRRRVVKTNERFQSQKQNECLL